MNEIEVTLHWIYVGIMVLSGISFYVLGKDSKGIPYYKYTIHMFIVFWSALGYSALALNQGTIVIFDQVVHYARYLDWVVTTPLLLLSLCLTAKLTTRNEGWLIGTMIGAQVIMIVTGLVAELSATPAYQYFWYIIGCIALVVVLYVMWKPLLEISKTQGAGIEKVYIASAVYLTVQWILYPVVWLIGQPGLQIFDSFTTTILFLILPVVSKAGFGFFNLIKLRNLDPKYKPQPKPPHPSKPLYKDTGLATG
jgi:bacteriorhodopsin